MTQVCIRRVAAAVALATALTFAAPVQAAGWQTRRSGPGWFQAAIHWMARLWTGKETSNPSDTNATIPPSGGERGHGIDPDG